MMTESLQITHADLDGFRAIGDPLLDERIAALPTASVREMLGELWRSPTLPEDPRFRALASAIPPITLQERGLIETGQQVFALYGPEVLLILGCYSLPAAYAAANGVQVIHRSRRMQDDGRRRLFETAQWVINVMRPGELEDGALGHRSAIKVRLMHGLIRRHIRDLETPTPWAQGFGTPINQEDLAGTLLSFSLAVLRGLRKIGCRLTVQDEVGYLAAWRHIGGVLGVDPRLTPQRVADAEALATLIGQRQFRASPEGRELASDLADVIDGLFPVRSYGTSLMHFFLQDNVFGVNLVEILGLRPANWTRILVQARAVQKRFALRWLPHVPGAVRRRRFLARIFAQKLIAMRNTETERPFEVPPYFSERWRLRP